MEFAEEGFTLILAKWRSYLIKYRVIPANHRGTLKSQFEIEFEWTYLLHELTKEGDFLNFVSSFGPQVFDCGNREL